MQIPQISAHGVEELPEREKNNAVPAPPSHSENLLSHQPPIEQNQSDQQLPSTEQDQMDQIGDGNQPCENEAKAGEVVIVG